MTPLPQNVTEANTVAPLPNFRTLFKNSWRYVFGDVQRLAFLSGLMLLTMLVSIGVEFLNPPAGTAIGAPISDFMPVMIGSVLSMILSMLVYTYLATRIALPVNFVPADAIELTKKNFVPFTIVALVMSVMIMLGFVALIIPGVLLMVYLALSPWVVTAEGVSGKAALLRSVDLIRNRFWYVAIQFLLLGLAFLPVFVLALGAVAASTWYILMGGSIGWWFVPVIALLFFIVYAVPLLLALRFSFELYKGLVASYVPATQSWWWQGGLFTVLYIVSLIGVAVLMIGLTASYYFTAQQALPDEAFMFDAAELDSLEQSYPLE